MATNDDLERRRAKSSCRKDDLDFGQVIQFLQAQATRTDLISIIAVAQSRLNQVDCSVLSSRSSGRPIGQNARGRGAAKGQRNRGSQLRSSDSKTSSSPVKVRASNGKYTLPASVQSKLDTYLKARDAFRKEHPGKPVTEDEGLNSLYTSYTDAKRDFLDRVKTKEANSSLNEEKKKEKADLKKSAGSRKEANKPDFRKPPTSDKKVGKRTTDPEPGRQLLRRWGTNWVLDQERGVGGITEQQLLQVLQAPFKEGAFPKFLRTIHDCVVLRGPETPTRVEVEDALDEAHLKYADKLLPPDTVVCQKVAGAFNTSIILESVWSKRSSQDENPVQLTWKEFALRADRWLKNHPLMENTPEETFSSLIKDDEADDLVRLLSQ